MNMEKTRSRRVMLLIFSWLIFWQPFVFGETLVFSRSEGPINDISEDILREAYRRIGIEVKTIVYPAERALFTANKGEKVDGEVSRIAGIEKEYPQLLMVGVPLVSESGSVFAKTLSFVPSGWDSLRPYRIAIVTGAKFAENGTRGMKVVSVSVYRSAFTMLEMDRVDVVVANRIDGLQTIKEMLLNDIRILEPPLLTLNSYHYLHRKRADILPKITKVLQAMTTEGRIAAIYKAHVDALRVNQ